MEENKDTTIIVNIFEYGDCHAVEKHGGWWHITTPDGGWVGWCSLPYLHYLQDIAAKRKELNSEIVVKITEVDNGR
jgi:hypothetical protein